MVKTGESYTTARRRLLANAPDLFGIGLPEAPTGPEPDPGIDLDARHRAHIERRRRWVTDMTGRDMDEWIAILDQAGARSMTHREIWRLLADDGHALDGMAREAVVITYEQLSGRREVGQSCDGDYRAAVIRTATGSLDDALRSWQGVVGESSVLNGVEMRGEPRISASERFRYWRVGMADGTKVNLTIYLRPDGKVSIGLQHRPFADRDTAAGWQTFWNKLLNPPGE